MSTDYQTVNDVIIHLAYTAEHDDLLRESVEEVTGLIEGALLKTLRTRPFARTLSLRQDFSTAFNRIVHSAAGTPVKIELAERHLATVVRVALWTSYRRSWRCETRPARLAGRSVSR
jgi:hypothetical protein